MPLPKTPSITNITCCPLFRLLAFHYHRTAPPPPSPSSSPPSEKLYFLKFSLVKHFASFGMYSLVTLGTTSAYRPLSSTWGSSLGWASCCCRSGSVCTWRAVDAPVPRSRGPGGTFDGDARAPGSSGPPRTRTDAPASSVRRLLPPRNRIWFFEDAHTLYL
nr:unnamed protein product [Callosobruchus analis]